MPTNAAASRRIASFARFMASVLGPTWARWSTSSATVFGFPVESVKLRVSVPADRTVPALSDGAKPARVARTVAGPAGTAGMM